MKFVCRAKSMLGKWSLAVSVLVLGSGMINTLNSVASAGAGFQFSVPQPPKKAVNFLAATIESRWVNGNGYYPVTVTLNSLRGAVTQDRPIRVQLTVLGGGGYGSLSQVVSETFVISEGSSSVTGELLIPQANGMMNVSLAFFEGGYELRELRLQEWVGASSNYAWSESAPTVLVIDSKAPLKGLRPRFNVGMMPAATGGTLSRSSALGNYEVPDVRPLAQVVGMYNQTLLRSDPTKLELLNHINALSRLELLPPEELPSEWLSYSCCDLVIVGLDDLVAMKRDFPEKLQALREWVATGSALCVYGVGQDFGRLRDCEDALQMRGAITGWNDPVTSDFASFFDYDLNSQQGEMVDVNGQQQWLYGDELRRYRLSQRRENTVESPKEKARKRRAAQFVYCEFGLGHVFAMSAEQPFPGSSRQWSWLFRTLERTRYKWYERYGMSLNRENPDFWNWLIPGVGLPPVFSFLVLISIFAFVIGPVNYFVLQRMRRLYLLLVTVPAGALVVTLSLLLYAMVMDGFGTKCRVRSVTHIDQPGNVAVSWSRQTYYSSLAPSGGLVYPRSAAVYPLLPNPVQEQSRGTIRRLDWNENQELRRGYVRSRTPAQFMVVNALPCLSELQVKEGTKLQIENRLEMDLSLLVVRDTKGNLFVGREVSDGAAMELEPVLASGLPALNKQLRDIFADSQPAFPKGFRRNENWGYRNRYAYSYIDQQEPSVRTQTSILEKQLAKANGQLEKMPSRSYLAIVDETPQVPLGVNGAKEVSSFHLVIGKW